MTKDYSKKYSDLINLMGKMGEKIPNIMEGFSKMHTANTLDGALPAKTKELIALGIAITIRCEGCIVCHVHDALNSGANAEEIMETIGVAVLMGGGPSVVYGCEAMEALNQFKVLQN